MSDKLQKSESLVATAGDVGEAIERAIGGEDKPANLHPPIAGDVCACGHAYAAHRYVFSATFECRGAEHTRMFPRKPGDKPICLCERFMTLSNSAVPAEVVVGFAWNRCIGNVDDSVGPHKCPGAVNSGVDGKVYYCKCSCESCLSVTRALLVRGTTAYTGGFECVFYGSVVGVDDHMLCPVVDYSNRGAPVVCACECKECKRAWFSNGRPIVRDGKVVRTTPESINPVKLTEDDLARWKLK